MAEPNIAIVGITGAVGQEMIKNRKKVKNEYYVSEIYNMLLKLNAKFEIDIAEEFTALGTPNDLKKFEE